MIVTGNLMITSRYHPVGFEGDLTNPGNEESLSELPVQFSDARLYIIDKLLTYRYSSEKKLSMKLKSSM